MKIQIQASQIALQQSGLYVVNGEDEPLYVYDTFIVAYVNGKKYELNDYVQHGAVYAEYDPEEDYGGFWCANRNATYNATRFAERIIKRGVIDLAHWTEVEEQSLEERLAIAAWTEQQERLGLLLAR